MKIGIEYLSAGNRGEDPTSQIDADFALFKAQGITYVQVRLCWVAFYDANHNLIQAAIDNYKRLVASAERNGIQLIITFWTQSGSNTSQASFYPIWACDTNLETTFVKIISDPPTRQAWMDWVALCVQQFDSPAVVAWQVINEPYQRTYVTQIEAFIRDTAAVVRTYSNKEVSARFILGYNPMTSTWSSDGLTINNGSYFSASLMDYLDFLSLTIYLDPSSDAWNLTSRGSWSTLRETIYNARLRNKRVYVVEFGSDSTDVNVQAQFFRDCVHNKFIPYGLMSFAGWAWQSRGATAERFNLCYGIANPKPAFAALVETFPDPMPCVIHSDCPIGYHCEAGICVQDPVVKHVLTIASNPNATFTPPAGTYLFPETDNVEVSVTPASGYHIVNLLVDNISQNGHSVLIPMSQDHTVEVIVAVGQPLTLPFHDGFAPPLNTVIWQIISGNWG